MAAIRRRRAWERRGQEATPEAAYLSRRAWLRWAGFGGLSAFGLLSGCDRPEPAFVAPTAPPPPKLIPPTVPSEPIAEGLRDLYPAARNRAFTVGRDLTPERMVTTYNNFYEFGTRKIDPVAGVRDWTVRPWEVEVTGLVNKPLRIDVDDLARRVGVEERLYRFRCVEAWAMTVPWIGFEMNRLAGLVEPLGSAKYVRLISFLDPESAPGQKNEGYQWPYYEGLRMDEFMHPLALFVTGLYGRPLPKQNGAPLRAIVPWKYGYKSAKSIVRIEFVEERPATFWNDAAPSEYSFLSNVDPGVPHPRWSQKTERLLGQVEGRVPTLLYNGYADQVADLYG